MDTTPETPDHVPPSEEVLHAEHVAEHEALVRREKRKYYTTFLGLGFIAWSVIFLLYMIEAYYLVFLGGVVYVLIIVWTNIISLDHAYRDGFRVGAALGSLNVLESYIHAMGHVVEGDPPCEQAMKIRKVVTPHLWEDQFVREQIRQSMPPKMPNFKDPS